MKKLLFLTLILGGQSVFGSDFLLYMGAGGEEPKPGTIFDSAIMSMAEYLRQKPKVQASVSLNGGHSETEDIINKRFSSNVPKTQFTDDEYRRLITDYKNKLKNGEMKDGDQLMIYIDTHGAENDEKEKTHRISTSGTAKNLNTLAGSSTVSLDDLEDLKKIAKEKKVKLAIIDTSCHSGNSLPLADDNTCVISASGPKHYAYTDFAPLLTKEMTGAKNLEEAFLSAREKHDSPAFPMISTKAGTSVNDLIYENITPYLYHFDDKHDKLLPYLETHSSEYQLCLANQHFNSLMDAINKVEDLNVKTSRFLWWTYKQKNLDLTMLKKYLDSFKKSLELAAAKMRELKLDKLKEEITVKGFGTFNSMTSETSIQYTKKELLTTDFAQLKKDTVDRFSKETNSLEKLTLTALLSLYSNAQEKKEAILKAEPDLNNIPEKDKVLKEMISNSYSLNSSIATEERKLYNALYKQYQQGDKEQSNPCRNFKL